MPDKAKLNLPKLGVAKEYLQLAKQSVLAVDNCELIKAVELIIKQLEETESRIQKIRYDR